MTNREITTNGWTVDDHRRAEQIRTDRGMARTVIFDKVDPEPWKGALTPGIAALTVEWNAVQAATLTPDQQRAVNRGAHLAVFGTEPPAGEPIDFRKAFPGGVIVL